MTKQLQNTLFIVAFSLLAVFQVLTTNLREAYSDTPHEKNLQIQRMNKYPPSLARLGYILEAKKEVQFLKHVEENFFQAIDFGNYFPDPLPYFLSPFLFLGLYIFFKEREKRKLLVYGFLVSVVLATLIGQHAKYGQVLIMAFLILFTVTGILKIFRFKWK